MTHPLDPPGEFYVVTKPVTPDIVARYPGVEGCDYIHIPVWRPHWPTVEPLQTISLFPRWERLVERIRQRLA